MIKESKGEFKEFRDLLRRGIGTRTQKAFAEEIGLSKEHLNRILNNKEISRPSLNFIKKIAPHIDNIPERAFLDACGYEEQPIEERIKNCQAQLTGGMQNAFTTAPFRPWKSVEDAVRAIVDTYVEENGTLKFFEETDYEGTEHGWAEKYAEFDFYWGGTDHSCITHAVIYFSRTENGNILVSDYSAGPTEIEPLKKQMGRRFKEKLFDVLFAGDKKIYTDTGYGFYYDKTPEGFGDFLYKHQGTFCTDKKRSAMLKAIVNDGQDPDTVFEDFDTSMYGSGTGGAVAEILSQEIGVPFGYASRNEDLSEQDSRSCVMVEEKYLEDGMAKSPDFLLKLHDAALTLQIPEFGYFSYSYLMTVRPRMYNTKTFGFGFKDISSK